MTHISATKGSHLNLTPKLRTYYKYNNETSNAMSCMSVVLSFAREIMIMITSTGRRGQIAHASYDQTTSHTRVNYY